MGRLIYSAIASLDLYTADASGAFDWSVPSDEVHTFVNALERGVGTFLYGRRMYEVMAGWETIDDPAPVMREFAAIWRAATKVVYSRTLADVWTERTTLSRTFDVDAVRALKAGPEDVSVGGAGLAGVALAAGVVDEIQLFLSPVLVGGGTAALAPGLRCGLTLEDSRRFANGVVYLRYSVGGALQTVPLGNDL
ncbi:MAG TPA: dihydrofolate reductase family protein [Solirubrobacter sp.]|nr:dihydrofolate reductase family protein [Solirubrobacter sp.]